MFEIILEAGQHDLHPCIKGSSGGQKPAKCAHWTDKLNADTIPCVGGFWLDYHLATPAFAALARSEVIYKDERFSDHAPITEGYEFAL